MVDAIADRWKFLSTAAIFAVGVAGAVNEIFFRDDQRLSTLAFITGLLGLPAFFPKREE